MTQSPYMTLNVTFIVTIFIEITGILTRQHLHRQSNRTSERLPLFYYMTLIGLALVTTVGIIHHRIWLKDNMYQWRIILGSQKPLQTKRFYISNLSPKKLK